MGKIMKRTCGNCAYCDENNPRLEVAIRYALRTKSQAIPIAICSKNNLAICSREALACKDYMYGFNPTTNENKRR